MLTQRKARSRKDVLLIAVIIISLGASVYLIYVNVNYFASKNKVGDRFEESVMLAAKKAEGEYESVEWEFLGSGVDISASLKSMQLRQYISPLSLEDVEVGRPGIFDSLFSFPELTYE